MSEAPSIIQPSFSRGEIGPELAYRADLAMYQVALKTCRNTITSPYGGTLNRPGTHFLAGTKNNEVARLIRFKFNSQDAYALEFTHLKMRVYRNGGLVEVSPGVPFELNTPFTRDQLRGLRYTQSADVMDIVHPAHKPKKLRRFAHDNWTLADVSLVPSIAAPASATATTPGGGSGNTQTWRFQVTAVVDDGTNNIEESLPVTSNAVTIFASNIQATVTWPAVVGASYYNIYKDNAGAGVYGFVGRSTGLSFTDNNLLPTKTDTPPTGLDPFVGAGNFPSAVGYFQQRLAYAATDNNPQTLWFSRTGIFTNFGYSTPIKDDDSIQWTIASTEVNRINHLLPLRTLLTLTDGAEWTIQGSAAGFTSKTINGDPQTYNGISDLRPLPVNDTALYAQERGRTVTAIGYSLEADGFSGTDISLFSPHLLQEYSLVDWDYQKLPYSIVWGVREDGQMVSCTYLPQQDVTGWHRHDTDGQVLSVCCVPEGREDSVYLCVARVIEGVTQHYVERMASRQIQRYQGQALASYAYFVDCGLSYDGSNANPSLTVTVTGGTDWKYPEALTMTASASLFVVGDVGNEIQYKATPSAEPFRFQITAYTSSTFVTVRPMGSVPPAIRDVPFSNWAKALDSFSGLSHLEGKTVSILADGNVAAQQVVNGGTITLPDPAAIVHIGLPYRSEVETLQINVPGAETLTNKRKQLKSVNLLLLESRGGLVGATRDTLWEFKQREDTDDYGSIDLISTPITQTITDTWLGLGQFVVVQDDPLPMNILGLVPQFVVAGSE